ncbi:hypothetical protein M0805_000091 [Coniferiporia weirii]|nr:hypothetical protein M0805_000091 [Coniferiporia weirii]
MSGEDSQPNETRILPKGAGVPAIRLTQPKPPPFYKGGYRGRNGPASRHYAARFQSGSSRNASTSAGSPGQTQHMLLDLSPSVASYNNRPDPRRAQTSRNFQSPNLSGRADQSPSASNNYIRHNYQPYPRARSYSNSNFQAKQDTLGYNGANGRPFFSGHQGARPEWKRGALSPQNSLHDMAVDAPKNYLKTGSNNTHKSQGGRTSMGKSNDAMVIDENADMPSGSDVKLEDLIEINTSSNISTTHFASGRPPSPRRSLAAYAKAEKYDVAMADTRDTGVVLPSPTWGPSRLFRSGKSTLTYGPMRVPARFPSPDRTAILPEEPANEVIEIMSSPSPSPQPKDVECMVTEKSMSPAPSGSRDFYLEEEIADVIRLPRDNNDKARRLLISHTQDMSYVMSMCGIVRGITRALPRRQRNVHSPSHADKISIDDACLLAAPYDNIAVVAQAREESALSLIHFANGVESRITTVGRTSSGRDRVLRGVSAVTTLPTSGSSLSFVSAGYDHIVHLWSLDASLSSPPISGVLNVRHTSTVQSLLAVSDTSPKLLSAGADCYVHVYDLPSERTLSTIRTSNSVYQLHSAGPECVLLEVAHRDSQFELYDYRMHTGRPVQRFGYETSRLQGRYRRGDVDTRDGMNTFASGGRDGQLRLWDLRNCHKWKQEIMCFPDQKIAQTKFDGDNVIVVSDDNRVMFFKSTSG